MEFLSLRNSTSLNTTSEQRSTGEWCEELDLRETTICPYYHGQTFSLTESPTH